jgi:uncharacterized RDD family membrane protein YckC
MQLTGDWGANKFDRTAFYGWGIPGYLLVMGLIIYLEGEKGWTPGKRVLGMRVEDAVRAGTIGWVRGLLRRVTFFISALPLGLGLLWPVWDRRRQTWHDKIARSVVTCHRAETHGSSCDAKPTSSSQTRKGRTRRIAPLSGP